VFAILALIASAGSAQAQVARAFTTRFTTQTTGTLTLIGNTLMTCPATDGQCANAQGGGGGGNVNNQNFSMRYVDVDGDPSTFASSTATLSLPSGSTVLWAGLYWGGWSIAAARSNVKFAVPGGGYATLSAQQLDAIGSAYQGFVDVTSQVRAAGNGVYAVADVQSTPATSDVWAGWGLVIAYRLATLPSRNLTISDGFVFTGPGSDANFSVSGFLTPPTGTVQAGVGFLAYDGDLGHTGEDLILNSTTLSDALNPLNNVFNSTISLLGSRFSAKNPDYVNQLGFDADLLAANGVLGNGTSSAAVTLKSASDRYYAGVILFDTDIFVPKFDPSNFRKTVTDLNGGAVRPGDVLEYTVSATNVGTDAALQTVVLDTLPAGLTYVAGSLRVASGPNAGPQTDAAGDDEMEYVPAARAVVARLGTGANATTGGRLDINASTSIVFRAQVTPPAVTGTVVANQASLSCVGQQLNQPLTAVSDGDPNLDGEQPTSVTVTSAAITGTVFEDVNYGGGAGRTQTTAAGVPCGGARVELYDASGNFVTATTTNAAGLYTLDGWIPGSYTVRVVNASVASTRPGSVAGLVPVQVFRTDASLGSADPVSDRVGGEIPGRADAPANTTGAALGTLTSAGTTAQSVSPVTFSTGTVSGVDFGFNFDTIVNANDAGQGSLRQFVSNANALANAGLAQSGLTAGIETSLFMVSDGAAHAGLRAGVPNLLTGGVVLVTCATPLPALSDAATRLDGGNQTARVGDTNPAFVGAATSVGVSPLTTTALAGPEVELRGAAGVAIGLDLEASDLAVANLALLSFGIAAGSDASAGIRVGATATHATIDRCVLGATALSFTAPAAALRMRADQVRVVGGGSGTLRDCLLGFGAGSGLALTAGASGWRVDGCTLLGNASGNATLGQVVVSASGTLSMTRSLVQSGDGPGVDALGGTGGITLDNLTVRLNGRGAGPVSAGVRAGGGGGTVSRCVVQDNFGAGVQVTATASGWTLTHNAMSGNGSVAPNAGGAASGQVGIDLQSAADNPATGTSPFVTRNDNADGDAGGNGLLNFPALESAVVSNGSFTLSGWARPGATIEVFVSDGDASGFGEGATYLTTLTEGSASDLDPGASAYGAPLNGLNQGTDNTNRFRFTLPVPAGVAVGTRLTATATLAGSGTSEFSGVVTVGAGVSVSGFAYADADHDAQKDAGEAGTGLPLWVKLVAASATAASQVVAVTPLSGAYAFSSVAGGNWTVVLDDSSDPADLTPGVPSGWLGTEHASGTLLATVNATDVTNANFGLFAGSRASGVLFRDDGQAGGIANDGARNGSESALASLRVRLTGGACPGGVCDSTLTDGAGAFTLWLPAAAAGVVSVRATGPAGWLATGGGAGTAPGAYQRASDAVTFTATPGTASSGLAFGHVPPNAWVAPSAQGVQGGTPALYRHTYTAGSDGAVSVSASTVLVPPVSGWGLTLWRDTNCNGALDAGEATLPASVALAAGQQLCVIAKQQAPLGAAVGARAVATLTASFTYDNASPALADARALDDVTTITFANGLVIAKSVDRAMAQPGGFLVYTITYSNPGTVPLSNIVIRDATPPWTVFDTAGCATLGFGITGCALSQQPAAGASGSVAWTLAGALAPGGSGSVSFRVRVN
jgi:uncharacterized repeat protein (TIGR01451 family)